ncbi:hypothetical protein Q8F55_002959 [Vanrija albida]|uniref:Amine oxidase n=1 Tax=Vanrija albida TaxID=181172 RepID=A0ABR3QB98_9TREE
MNEAEEPLLKGEGYARSPHPPARRRWATALAAGALAILALAGWAYRSSSAPDAPQPPICAAWDEPSITAPRKNIWRNLDLGDAVALRAWLHDPARGLNLTDADAAADSDNFIHLVEAYHPRKADALAYLAGGELPARYARAVINHGPAEKVVDYLVGPLPLSPHTRIVPNTAIYHAGVPLNARSTFKFPVLTEMITRIMSPIDDITRTLFNMSAFDGSLTISAQMPLSYDGAWRRTWIQLKHNAPGSWIRSVDFYALVDMSGTDASLYHAMAFVTAGKLYRSYGALRAAYDAGELRRGEWDASDWASRRVRGKPRDLDDRAGPRQVLPDGRRYRVDTAQDYITWMGWAFYLGFERDMGLHLWDLRFRGERVIYELAPQEAMAQYSGSDPHQASTVWLDRAFGMGGNVREVMAGYDCPEHATLLNATVHEGGSTLRRNAICVYERVAERPLSRHTGRGEAEFGAVKGYELVVRSISTVGNYDYIFDYTFQLDGSLEIRVSASGYLQSGSWDAAQGAYGHQIREGNMGSLHDHVINYKIDFDVAGVNNSFMRVRLESEERDDAWFGVDGWGPVVQSKLVRQRVAEESVLEFPPNMEGAYVVTNEDAHNAWGNPRGYQLHPGPLCRLANVHAKRTEHSVNWAKHHLAVSRQSDDEPSSSSMWNGNLPGAPPVNFYKFFNNESLHQADLVVWANLGTHHIPRAEDAPNTLTNVATSYLLLSPWNFHDHDVAMESRNSVLLANEGGTWRAHEAVAQPRCAAPPPPPLRYEGLAGWREDGSRRPPGEMAALRTHADAIHAFGM